MATDGELISLMSHTLGSIGQVVKDQALTGKGDAGHIKIDEIKRIYEGYVHAIKNITNQP